VQYMLSVTLCYGNIMENETRYNIVTNEDEILELDLDLFSAESMLYFYIDNGYDAFIETAEIEDDPRLH
jgi:hypothetical protein